MSESSEDQIATAKHQPNSITSDSHRVTPTKLQMSESHTNSNKQQPTANTNTKDWNRYKKKQKTALNRCTCALTCQ
ncbi:hypothetical protein BO83DRAFT_196842 [Aspergillus eucalypticola CBS 122712]|uniref:Uncharacterized protein n=1 Tax=Aspergillus eucalypticola (strain CBS 122712 / IBT 29274) TaxID=1448314 RepID=A0A317W017_ASPEC|nr:uncharacterized protein BO83DRAFT_196842 [Aspergillus eucalypticola CBS 122712]PWY79843.1 hypothetical protein BO83DRAFT_196842 [Aspergillus eucalypticola CBS 122712]